MNNMQILNAVNGEGKWYTSYTLDNLMEVIRLARKVEREACAKLVQHYEDNNLKGASKMILARNPD